MKMCKCTCVVLSFLLNDIYFVYHLKYLQASSIEDFGDSWSESALSCPATPADTNPCAADTTLRDNAVTQCSTYLNDTSNVYVDLLSIFG